MSSRTFMVEHPIRLCDLADLPDGESRGFDPLGAGRDSMFVVRRGHRLHAYVDACPHWTGGDGQQVVCSAHGARFDIDTGACVLGPCLGQALTPVSVSIADDGVILFDFIPFTETSHGPCSP